MSNVRLLTTYVELAVFSALLWASDRFERICPAWSRYRERRRRAYLAMCARACQSLCEEPIPANSRPYRPEH
jgi:hypothetical protein